MKTRIFFCCLLGAWLLGSSVPLAAQAPGIDNAAIARRLVRDTLQVKKGEKVMLFGDPVNYPELVEAVRLEIRKAGAFDGPIFLASSPRLARATYEELPVEFLSQGTTLFADTLNLHDAYLILPTVGGPDVLKGLSEAKIAAVRKADEADFQAVMRFRGRALVFNLPSPETARFFGADHAALTRVFVDAIDIDYAKLRAQQDDLERLLRKAEVHITAPDGTDLWFRTGERPVQRNDGDASAARRAKAQVLGQRVTSLPAGSFACTGIETSARGKIRTPFVYLRGNKVEDIEGEFEQGKLLRLKAAKNDELLQEVFAKAGGDKDRFASISFGMNPKIQPLPGSDFRPLLASGVVFVSVGDNRALGGQNKSDFGFSFRLEKATVTVGGKTILRDGDWTL